jgi:hypothetical protein
MILHFFTALINALGLLPTDRKVLRLAVMDLALATAEYDAILDIDKLMFIHGFGQFIHKLLIFGLSHGNDIIVILVLG